MDEELPLPPIPPYPPPASSSSSSSSEDLPLPPIPPAAPPALRWLPRAEAERIGATYGGWGSDNTGGAGLLVRAYWPFLAAGLGLLALLMLRRR